jgi:hypothetical protein
MKLKRKGWQEELHEEELLIYFVIHFEYLPAWPIFQRRGTSLLSSSKLQTLPERFRKYRIHEEGRGQRRG